MIRACSVGARSPSLAQLDFRCIVAHEAPAIGWPAGPAVRIGLGKRMDFIQALDLTAVMWAFGLMFVVLVIFMMQN